MHIARDAEAAFLPLPELPGFVLGIGASLFIVSMLIALAEAVAGFALLQGSATGKAFVIVFGILDLLHFPFGTLLGIHTLWALLRKQPLVQARSA